MEERTEYGVATGTAVDMQAAINAFRQQQAEQCAAIIETALKQHQCELRAAPIIMADGRVGATVQIVCVG